MTTSQTPRDRFAELMAERVAREPDPPRTITQRDAIVIVLSSRSSIFLVVVGILTFIGGILIVVEPALGILSEVLAFMSFLALAVYTRRVLNALRAGVRAQAEVLDVMFLFPHYSSTPDALRFGQAVGRLRLYLDSGSYEEKFSFAQAWVRYLAPGRRIEVLADPVRCKVLFGIRVLPNSKSSD